MTQKMIAGMMSLTLSFPLHASYYPFGDELDKKHSDHKMFATDIDDQLSVAIYNSWGRGTYNGFMGERGYEGGRIEPNVDERTNNNIKKIHEFLQKHPKAIVGLQEWNQVDLEKLGAALNPTYEVLSSPTLGESFSHCIVYNKAKYQRLSQSSDDLAALNNLTWKVPQGTTGTQKNRYLHATLRDNTSSQNLEVVTVHLKWQSTMQDIGTALQNLFNTSTNMVIMGDFNQDLTSFNHQGIKACISNHGSQVYDFSTKKASFKTNDAILYKLAGNPSSSQPLSVTPQRGEMYEFNALLNFIIPQLRPQVITAYEFQQFDMSCTRALASIPHLKQEEAYMDLFEAYMSSNNNNIILKESLAKIINYYTTQPQHNMMPYSSGNQHYPYYSYSMMNSVITQPFQQLSRPTPYSNSSSFVRPSYTINNWGRFNSFEECLSKGITGKLQNRVKELYNDGFISAQQIVALSSVPFRDQATKWGEIMRVSL